MRDFGQGLWKAMDVDRDVAHFAQYDLVFFVGESAANACLAVRTLPFGLLGTFGRLAGLLLDEAGVERGLMAGVVVSSLAPVADQDLEVVSPGLLLALPADRSWLLGWGLLLRSGLGRFLGLWEHRIWKRR